MNEKETKPEKQSKTKPEKEPKPKTKPKPAKPKPAKPKPKKTKEVKPKPKKTKPKKGRVLVETISPEKEQDPERYSDKLKHLLFKIKNQNNFNDFGIRFAWRNS